MSIAKILVPVTGVEKDAVAIEAAIVAAKPFNAHVRVLFIPPDPRFAVPVTMGEPVSPDIVQEIVDTLAEMNRKSAKAAQAMLAKAAASQGAKVLEHPDRGLQVTCSFKDDMGYFANRVARAARHCDLVVFSSLPDDLLSEVNQAFVETLTKANRPVLMAPVVPATLTAKVTIAWDGSVASAHALSGALPFLVHAGKVEFLEVKPLRDDAASVEEAKEYLSLHGVASTTRIIKRGADSVGELLLKEAADGGASLLVMGGYGHSHLRETIFGGVSAHIKWHATLPVLMVH